MPADVPIALPVGNAPLEYQVPNATEVVPKAVNAVFDGTSASGSFVPTVEFVSDGGIVVARVPCSTTVAAGGSAEVTFAPFLRPDNAATPSTSWPAWVLFTLGWGPNNFPATGSELPFTTPRASFGGTFTVDGSGHLIVPRGLWLLYSSMQLEWEAVDSPPPAATTYSAYDIGAVSPVSSTVLPLAGTPALPGTPFPGGAVTWYTDYILWAMMDGTDALRIRNDSDSALNATGAGPAVAQLEFLALQIGTFS